MPYIKEYNRNFLKEIAIGLVVTEITNPGELNYLFTRTILRYITCKGESYQTYNDIIGALEACKLEIYRRKISPYEDKKIKENGDLNGMS